MPQIVEQAVDGVAGQTTYRLNLRLGPRAENVYTIYGSSSGGTMSIPAGFQVAAPFGANTGGTSPLFADASPDSPYDSWLTVGLTEGDSAGALSSVGIDWDSWTADAGLEIGDGALFWTSPADGPTGEGDARAVTVAQITIPTGTAFAAAVSAQGRGRRSEQIACVTEERWKQAVCAPGSSCEDGTAQEKSAELSKWLEECKGLGWEECGDATPCVADSGCSSGLCHIVEPGGTGTCVSYFNGMMDGAESDVDCGGDPDFLCGMWEACDAHTDCISGYCARGVCTL
eukprot:COSAG04_NODE_6504_length_1313_cov_0.626030_1_plen_285_part_10